MKGDSLAYEKFIFRLFLLAVCCSAYLIKIGREAAGYVEYDQRVYVEILKYHHGRDISVKYNEKIYLLGLPSRYKYPRVGEMYEVYYNPKIDNVSVFEADYTYTWGKIIFSISTPLFVLSAFHLLLQSHRVRGKEYIKIGSISIKVPKIKENKKDNDSYIAQTPYQIKEIEVPNQKVRSWRKKRKMKRGG